MMTKPRDQILTWLLALSVVVALGSFTLAAVCAPLAAILWILSKQGC
jgi:hypothetical protein